MGNKSKHKGKYNTGSGRVPHGFKHAKSLGQNFLNDQNVIDDIVEGSEIDEQTLVVEIGPGEVYIKAIVDESMRAHGLTKTRIVGNLPYYITTPIITKLIESKARFESLTVMMQKEVGDRIAADPGTKLAGAITYAVHYRCTVDKVCDVSRESFYPVPKVDSVVLRLNMRDELAVQVNDENNFFRCIKAGFSMRRKTLLNSLQALDDVNKDVIKHALESANIDPSRRAETLTMEEFAELSNSIWKE